MRLQRLDCERLETLELEHWEKIRNRGKTPMPVRRSLSATRGMHETAASRKASRRVSNCHGGIHRRHYRKVM
jgi:hypothetical protein